MGRKRRGHTWDETQEARSLLESSVDRLPQEEQRALQQLWGHAWQRGKPECTYNEETFRTETIAKRKASNREAEADHLTSLEEARGETTGAASWGRVVSLIDVKAKAEEGRVDPARMRSVLIRMKSNKDDA